MADAHKPLYGSAADVARQPRRDGIDSRDRLARRLRRVPRPAWNHTTLLVFSGKAVRTLPRENRCQYWADVSGAWLALGIPRSRVATFAADCEHHSWSGMDPSS